MAPEPATSVSPAEATSVAYRPADWRGGDDLVVLLALLAGVLLLLAPESPGAVLAALGANPLTLLLGYLALASMVALLRALLARAQPAARITLDPTRRAASARVLPIKRQSGIEMFDVNLHEVEDAVVTSQPVAWRPAWGLGLVAARRLGYVPVLLGRTGARYRVHVDLSPTPEAPLACALALRERLRGLAIAAGDRSDDPPPSVPVILGPRRMARWLRGTVVAVFTIGSGYALGAGVPGVAAWLTSPDPVANARGIVRYAIGNPLWVDDLATLHRGKSSAASDESPDVWAGPAAPKTPGATVPEAGVPTAAAPVDGAPSVPPVSYHEDLQGPEMTFLHVVSTNDYAVLQAELELLLAYYRKEKRASQLAVRVLRGLAVRPVKNVGATELVLILRCLGEVGRADDSLALLPILEKAERQRMGDFTAFEHNAVVLSLKEAVAAIRSREPFPLPTAPAP